MTTTDTPLTNTQLIENLDSLAEESGINPDLFRTLLVQEFCSDLITQMSEFLEVANKLTEGASLVSPRHSDELSAAVQSTIPAIESFGFYLAHLQGHPLDWPESRH